MIVGVPSLLLTIVIGMYSNWLIAVMVLAVNLGICIGIYWQITRPIQKLVRSLQWRVRNLALWDDRIRTGWKFAELQQIAQSFNDLHAQVELGKEQSNEALVIDLLNSIPGLAAILNPRLDFIQVNQNLCEFLNLTTGELLNQSLSNYEILSTVHKSLLSFLAKDQTDWSKELCFNLGEKEQHFWFNAYRVDDKIILTGIDITHLKEAESKWRKHSSRDPLTGLANRIQFNASLAIALERAEEENSKLAILFFDLDRFRIVNDSLGHIIGDLLLQTVAKVVKEEIKTLYPDAVIARWGGDEFTIMLSNISSHDLVIATARQLLTRIDQDFLVGGYNLRTTASIGIAFYPEDGEDNESLIKNADAALHFAKARGRNNVQVYSRTMNINSHEILILENSLHRAIAQEEFVVYYQPKVNTFTGKITGLEALLRWQNPELGLVMPNDFVPLAEENGMVVPIGEFVLREVCHQNSLWRNQCLPMLPIAVNLSARQFLQPNLLEVVDRTLKESGIPAEFLELEITETLAINDLEITRSILRRFYQMGVRITIDDFGTGYSAYSSLKHFPVHALKIDKSFIQDLESDQHDRAIVQSIIALCHGLQLKVIAEGVETMPQLEILKSMHCTEIQGYLFSRPLPADAMTKLLKDTGNQLLIQPHL